MHGPYGYEDAEALRPYDRLHDLDTRHTRSPGQGDRRHHRRGQNAYVTISNHAEGCAL